jgi:hypothetical protein
MSGGIYSNVSETDSISTEVKPVWVKKQGGLGVESHENSDDGAVDL